MRLTRAGEYAIRCALYLSYQGTGVVVTRKEIARVMDIPNPFLGKIAQQLARAAIIDIVQGARGGYRLLVSPDRLNLLAVVEAVIGEIVLNDCLMNPDTCFRSRTCAVHQVWDRARNQLRETLRQTRFSQLMTADTCTADLIEKAATPLDIQGVIDKKGTP